MIFEWPDKDHFYSSEKDFLVESCLNNLLTSWKYCFALSLNGSIAFQHNFEGTFFIPKVSWSPFRRILRAPFWFFFSYIQIKNNTWMHGNPKVANRPIPLYGCTFFLYIINGAIVRVLTQFPLYYRSTLPFHSELQKLTISK